MNEKRKWEVASLNDSTECELSIFLDSITGGRMSKPCYELGVISNVVNSISVPKDDLVGLYISELLECETYEEMVEYLKELKCAWS